MLMVMQECKANTRGVTLTKPAKLVPKLYQR
jgi:hypothetical protein